MPSPETKEKIRKFILTNFMVPPDARNFADSDSFLKKGVIDSMGVVELLNFVKREFGIEVKGSEIVPANFDTLESLCRFVEKKQGR